MYKVDFVEKGDESIIFTVESSLGEFDNIIPICIKIKNKNPLIKITIFCLNKEIYFQSKNIFFIKKFLKNYNIKLILPINLIKIKKFFFKIFKANLILISEQHRLSYTIFFLLLKKIFNKKVIQYRHSNSPLYIKNVSLDRYNFIKKKIGKILTSKEDAEAYNRFSKEKNYYTNIPHDYKDYLNFGKSLSFKKKFILIYSYKDNNHYFKSLDKLRIYSVLINNLKKKFRNFTIVIKPHPAENIKTLKKIMTSLNYKKYIITDKNSICLIHNCILAISINTNGGLFSYYNNIPTINYIDFLSYKKYLRYQASSNDNKVYSQSVKAGIKTAFNERVFSNMLNNIDQKKEKFNKIIKIIN